MKLRKPPETRGCSDSHLKEIFEMVFLKSKWSYTFCVRKFRTPKMLCESLESDTTPCQCILITKNVNDFDNIYKD